jgi:hypothetical protein
MKRHATRLRPRTSAALFNALEPRRLMAVFSASDASDTIDIFASGSTTTVRINGVDFATTQTTIDVNALGGADFVNVNSTRAGTTVRVFGGDGNDFIINPPGDMDANYRAAFTFEGGAGVDSVAANNLNDSTVPARIEISDSLIVKDQSIILFRHRDIESLLYSDSDGSNRIGFLNLQGPQTDVARTTILGNGGNDFIINASEHLGRGYYPTAVGSGGIMVSGGLGSDTIELENSLDNGATFTVEPTRITVGSAFSDAGPMTYSDIESFSLVGADGADLVKLRAKPASMSMLVQPGAGNDTVLYEGGDIDDSGFFVANTQILAGPGSDTIEFDDRLDASDPGEIETYTFDSNTNTLAKGAAGFAYSGFEQQTLKTGDAVGGPTVLANAVNLDSISSSIASTTIVGGSVRQNTLRIGNGNLSTLPGAITLNLGTAGSFVNFRDEFSSGDRVYELHANQLVQPRPIPFTGTSWASRWWPGRATT